ncbi:Cytochrome c biogenesis protein CcsA [Rubripirellula amarantea]|uniref:Cytochrome c biogenesis protein CcsA n=1 Tax=Rubripirellula amarantea TaxID=2527999 RepID=A0A5C5WS09_9BACT|nr:cytochrome c biogenesis protein CcsA [Rubripirellula amarantea]TWT53260.1 Cytochrome c biogenesis protein CcsA [Rubripirellula amarantea]
MATISKDIDSDILDYPDAGSRRTDVGVFWDALRLLGSLKLTVVLFACSLVIVLVGTLAQDEMNMLEVKQRYFLSWIAPMHVDDFFPKSFFPHEEPLSLVIPFPGGTLIGLMLMLNLVAAKATRFKVHSRGGKLISGIAFIALGIATAALIVWAGNSADGLQGEPGIGYQPLWALTLAGTALLGMSGFYGASKLTQPTLRNVAFVGSASLIAFVGYALLTDFRIGDPGLRIVWQLAKGLGAGLVLMVGCLLVFEKQGGNVLLHLGVGLLMLGQFVFGDRQLEQRLNLVEGQSTNTLVNLNEIELTFIQTVGDEKRVTAVPGSRLQSANLAVGSKQPGDQVPDTLISDPSLPVDIRVLEYYDNSTFADVNDQNLATAGNGLKVMATGRDKFGGADSKSNLVSAYVELLDKDSKSSLGVHLVSQLLSEQEMLMPDKQVKDLFDEFEIDGEMYEIGLRFHREVKPYWVQLEDVKQVTYSGTSTPRDFSSYIRIINEDEGDDLNERVWMNNPLRYRGETFYQSNYNTLPNGKEQTGIQVVQNSGWLIPYVACSITGLGMLVHFLGTLTRFVRRRERETKKEQADLAGFEVPKRSRMPVVLTVLGFSALATYMLVPWSAVMSARRPETRTESFDFYAAGKIPVQFGGRVMPLDAYARQTLKSMSNKESVPLDEAPLGIKSRSQSKRSLSAMQWLMESAIDKPELRELRMFRIDAEEVRSELDLNRRKSKLYSLDEIISKSSHMDRVVAAAREKESGDLSFKEKKVLELNRRLQQFYVASASFQLPVPDDIPLEKIKEVIPDADEQTRQMLMIRELERRMDSLARMETPAIVVPTEKEIASSVGQPTWSTFSPAFFGHYSELAMSADLDAEPNGPIGVESFGDMIKAYAGKDYAAFNEAVDQHLSAIKEREIPGYKPGLVSLERWMQNNWPTGVATVIYLCALVMGLLYLFYDKPALREAVWGTLALALMIHTVAILCRITITGRAPVINLYSSAVFIGWASVLFGMVIERIFKYGIGNLLSAASGVMTLLVAYGLNKGDTMPVLQAVLDTQFWLATHVISVTLGYVATLVAGAFGIGYLISGWIGKDEKSLRDIYRCCYGAACFGILFSFIGTVLGGLWADDSWGRFWGWDPKENGALLIVIWNALLLHARWDGMVKGRGFARLAIVGNIVTAWSWFGTNELGIGLHSYGFTTGVMWWLSVFVASQLIVIVIDMLVGLFQSSRSTPMAPSQS